MQLDSEKQRELLLTLIKVMNIPGSSLDEIFILKQAIQGAGIISKKTDPQK